MYICIYDICISLNVHIYIYIYMYSIQWTTISGLPFETLVRERQKKRQRGATPREGRGPVFPHPRFRNQPLQAKTLKVRSFPKLCPNCRWLSLTVVEPAWNKKNWRHWNVIDILSPFSSCIDILASLVTSLGDPCGGAVVLDVLALEGSSALAQVIGVHDSECETLVPEPWHAQIHA